MRRRKRMLEELDEDLREHVERETPGRRYRSVIEMSY